MKSFNNKGITALDILLIIVILIVLAAVLFPVRTSCGSNGGYCQNNLKQCAIALQCYWNDYDSHLPSSALVNHSKKWNKDDFLTFATKTAYPPSKKGTQPKTWTELLRPYIKRSDIVFCPKDREKDSDGNRQVSYWWKLAIDKAWYGEHCTKPCRKESDFNYFADQIVLFERAGFHLDDTSGLKNGTQINVVYLDSHVKTIVFNNATSGNPKNCAANLDGEPMYFNYDNKTKKQLDKNTPAKFIDPARYSDKL